MIVVAKPPSLGISPFNQQLDSLENVLHKMQRYSHRLNVQIGDIKKLVDTNERVISRLKRNEQRMKVLLEDFPNPVEHGMEVVRLGNDVGSFCHLHRSCKVANIREICWTHCNSSTSGDLIKEVQQEEPYREAHIFLGSPDSGLGREQGGEDRQLPFGHNTSQYQTLVDRVNYIMKVIENLDMKKKTIKMIKKVCKSALAAMLERQRKLSSNGPKIQRTGKRKTHGERANPYLWQ